MPLGGSRTNTVTHGAYLLVGRAFGAMSAANDILAVGAQHVISIQVGLPHMTQN